MMKKDLINEDFIPDFSDFTSGMKKEAKRKTLSRLEAEHRSDYVSYFLKNGDIKILKNRNDFNHYLHCKEDEDEAIRFIAWMLVRQLFRNSCSLFQPAVENELLEFIESLREKHNLKG